MSLSLLFVSMVTLPFAILQVALAHGPPPSGCALYYGLEYQSELTSLIVDNGQQEYDVISNPGATVPVTRDQQFQVRFTLHTDEQGFRMENGSRVESNSSSEEGYAWYRDFANGYPYSKCAGPMSGDADYEISQQYPVSHMFQGAGPHLVFFETSLDDSQPKGEFFLQVVEILAEPEAEEQNSEIPEEQPSEGSVLEDESILTPFISQSNETESASVDAALVGDSLTINGTLASLAYPVNESADADALTDPDIIAGNWFMKVNDTSVSDFQANLTVVSADGIDRKNYSIANFTAVNASAVVFGSNLISVASSSIITADDSEETVSVVITLERLNAMRIDLDGTHVGNATGPIYGVVDKLIIGEGGQETLVISR